MNLNRLKKLNEELDILTENTGEKMWKNKAILRYICGRIALETKWDIEDYDEYDLSFYIKSILNTYKIEVDEDKVWLTNWPDANYDNIYAETEITDFMNGNIANKIDKAIKITEDEVVPQLEEIEDKEDLSNYAKELLGLI